MNASHLHLVINHFPIFATLFGTLLLGYGLFTRKRLLENAGLVTLIISGLVAIPTFVSGAVIGKSVANILEISAFHLEKHLLIARWAFGFSLATGFLALAYMIGLWMKMKMGLLRNFVFLLSLATLWIMISLATHGTKIRHSELGTQKLTITKPN